MFQIYKNRELDSFVLLTTNKKLPLWFNIFKFRVMLFVNEITFKKVPLQMTHWLVLPRYTYISRGLIKPLQTGTVLLLLDFAGVDRECQRGSLVTRGADYVSWLNVVVNIPWRCNISVAAVPGGPISTLFSLKRCCLNTVQWGNGFLSLLKTSYVRSNFAILRCVGIF